jgi:hypothetical protein
VAVLAAQGEPGAANRPATRPLSNIGFCAFAQKPFVFVRGMQGELAPPLRRPIQVLFHVEHIRGNARTTAYARRIAGLAQTKHVFLENKTCR